MFLMITKGYQGSCGVYRGKQGFLMILQVIRGFAGLLRVLNSC